MLRNAKAGGNKRLRGESPSLVECVCLRACVRVEVCVRVCAHLYTLLDCVFKPLIVNESISETVLVFGLAWHRREPLRFWCCLYRQLSKFWDPCILCLIRRFHSLFHVATRRTHIYHKAPPIDAFHRLYKYSCTQATSRQSSALFFLLSQPIDRTITPAWSAQWSDRKWGLEMKASALRER